MHNIILDFSMENIYCNCMFYKVSGIKVIWKYTQFGMCGKKEERGAKKTEWRKVKKFNDKLQAPETVEYGAE